MASKTAVARHEGGARFTITTGSGHSIVVDDAEGNSGPRPVEMVLVGQAGCTGMDVISILRKKRQEVVRYAISITAVQRSEQHPHVFTRADVVHEIEGPALDEAAVRRAIELSATRYCSVAAMLSAGTVEIHHRYRIVSGDSAPVEGEVIVTGPRSDPDALAAAHSAGPGAADEPVAPASAAPGPGDAAVGRAAGSSARNARS